MPNQKKARKIQDVIHQLLKITPADQADIYARLLSMKSSVEYAAPEAKAFWWRQLTIFVNTTFPPMLTEQWEIEFIAIFTDQTTDVVREQFAKKD